MNLGVAYQEFYDILLNVRELFHAYGRIDDANAKLDEIIKIILLSYYEASQKNRFSLTFVKEYAVKEYNDPSKVASALRQLFSNACNSNLFRNSDGTCIFGTDPSLSIQPSENTFAEKLILEIEKIDFVNLTSNQKISDFDIINECFGHFVRENFRNNKEDAQYMTPAEISSPILDIVFSDIIADNYLKDRKMSSFKIMDPTCGVGTLLIESARRYIEYVKNNNFGKDTNEIIQNFLKNGVIGQDKVSRMVRFSKINSLLLGIDTENISVGNSISEHTTIDEYKGQIDLIFTNPPFGADYDISFLQFEDFSYLESFKFIKKTICSEILMILKCLELLRTGGYLVIVLPDSIFSAKGVFAEIRSILLANCEIRAIIELPAVTFAQAGTRTKTSVCYLRKRKSINNQEIVMGICNDIGYNVKERMGVPIKIKAEHNDIIDIAKAYITRPQECTQNILNQTPSVTTVKCSELLNGVLNPSFYSATRFETLQKLEKSKIDGIRLCKLKDLVDFRSLERKSYMVDENIKHISVLHINPNSIIDFNAVEAFYPVSKGRECFPGDLLYSKINPRIPRVAVVPEYGKKLVCSNEFEIMTPKDNVDTYVLCLLLKSSYVQKQIEDLTSGTSSSHSRIKREQLANIIIPYPTEELFKQQLQNIGVEIKNSFSNIYVADQIIFKQSNQLGKLITGIS